MSKILYLNQNSNGKLLRQNEYQSKSGRSILFHLWFWPVTVLWYLVKSTYYVWKFFWYCLILFLVLGIPYFFQVDSNIAVSSFFNIAPFYLVTYCILLFKNKFDPKKYF